MSWQKKYGEWAIVTGASSGIGKAFALDLARRGMNIILIARRTEKLKEVAAECELANVETCVCSIDLTQSNALQDIRALVADKEVGVLVNNAGIVARGFFSEVDLQRQLDIVSLHCTIPVALTHQYLAGMLFRNRGAIITISSIIAYQFQPFLTTYAAAKEFDLRFGKSLSWELRNTAIDTLTVIPGFTKTEAYQAADWKINFESLPFFLKPQSSQKVAKVTLDRLGKQHLLVLASPFERVVTNANRFLPASLVEPIFGKLFA